MPGGVPNQSLVHRFIFVPVDIPGGRDSRPIDLRVPAEQIIGKAPRGFRDNLQCTHYRVNRLSVGPKGGKIEIRSEPLDRIDVVNCRPTAERDS